MTGIYKITSPSGKIYIGQAVDINKRWKNYRFASKVNDHPRLKASFDKYGYLSHKFEVVETCDFQELNIRERYWQEYYEATGERGLNCYLTKANIKRKKVSQETKDKIRATLTGVKHSAERKAKISKIRGPMNLTTEQRLKKSENNKRRYLNPEARRKTGLAGMKPVYQFAKTGELIKKWIGASEVTRLLGIDSSTIIACIRRPHIHKSAGGFKWNNKPTLNNES